MVNHENPVIHTAQNESSGTSSGGMPSEAHGVIVVTSDVLPGMKIEKTLGLCYGTAVRSRNVFGNMFGNLRAAFGGTQPGYLRMINQTRDEAIVALKQHALSLGANAVVGMRFDSGEFDSGNGQSMNEVAAYGTAVIVAQGR